MSIKIRLLAAAVAAHALVTDTDAFGFHTPLCSTRARMPCAPGRHPGLAPYGTSSRSRRIRLAGHAGLGRLAMQTETGEEREGKPHVAVVGAGWGGWAAAKALCENGCAVTLLDSLPDPAGERPWLTPSGKPFEPGQRGFWNDYPNLEALLAELGVPIDEVLTRPTGASFYGAKGLEATMPVLGAPEYAQLPSPLGQAVAAFPGIRRLPIADALTMTGLLYAMLDFNRDEETFEKYDRMTAHDLFVRMGLSQRLVDDFIRPTLLVGIFKPPEEVPPLGPQSAFATAQPLAPRSPSPAPGRLR
jgi:hypothetical protein